jgi:hypothetical protein
MEFAVVTLAVIAATPLTARARPDGQASKGSHFPWV